eukprot:TRINITY_DN765_c3_g1_i1.p1 TRINITY_DN765_c3_g1~~TRINITY_DN765_c3_g1_i1.p1  ORF type:complete len:625 (+),score=157.38 TRINITY_DN765_c3_g1_i1:89-1876(+)
MTAPLGRFDSSKRRFALVHNNTVRVFDVSTGELQQTLTPPSGADVVKTLSWSVSGKKGKAANYLGIGCESGSAYVWNIDTNEAAAEVSLSEPVVDISFCAQGKPTLAVASSTTLKVHDIPLNTVFCSGQLPRGTAAISLSGDLCAVSAKKLVVVRVEKTPEGSTSKKLQILHKFTGHTSPANWAFFDDKCSLLLTSSSSERHVAIWRVGESKKDAATSLQLPDHLITGDCNGSQSLAVTPASAVVHNMTTGEPFMTIQLKGSEGSLSQIIAASFNQSGGVVIAKGTAARPIFESVPLKEGGISINAMTAESTNIVMGATTSKKRKTAEVATTNKPMPAESLDTSALDSIHVTQSLGFRKREQQLKGTRSSDKIRITQSLQQALARNDKKQLDVLLDEGIARRVVDSSVIDLERIYALKLLRECTKRFQHKSSRAQHTLPWIKAVIAHHPQHLLSLSDLDAMLEPLTNVVNEHLQTYSHLSNLQGRLEVVVGRSKVLKDEVVRERGQPLRVVSEEDAALANSLIGDDENDDEISDIDMDIMKEVLGSSDMVAIPQEDDDLEEANGGDVDMLSQTETDDDEEEEEDEDESNEDDDSN